MGIVHHKSTWARRGLVVQNTVIEPGWHGYLTIELTNHGPGALSLQWGMPIAQIVFHRLEAVTEQPYGQQIPEPAIRAAIIGTTGDSQLRVWRLGFWSLFALPTGRTPGVTTMKSGRVAAP
jgi:dUTPase